MKVTLTFSQAEVMLALAAYAMDKCHCLGDSVEQSQIVLNYRDDPTQPDLYGHPKRVLDGFNVLYEPEPTSSIGPGPVVHPPIPIPPSPLAVKVPQQPANADENRTRLVTPEELEEHLSARRFVKAGSPPSSPE